MENFWQGFEKQSALGPMLARGALRAGHTLGHFTAPFSKAVGTAAPAAAKGTGLGSAFTRGFSKARRAAGAPQIAAKKSLKTLATGAALGAGGTYMMSGDQSSQNPNMYY